MFYYLIALVSYALPYIIFWNSIGVSDWDVNVVWSQIVTWWHERKNYTVDWNPFLCGGYPLWGNFQLQLFHPNVIFFLLFGPVVGLKISVIVWMSLGFLFAVKFFADYFGKKNSFLFAAIWALNAACAAHIGVMHVGFLSFFIIPGIFFFIRRWIFTERFRYLLGVAVLTFFGVLNSYLFLVYFFPSICMYFLLELIWSKKFSIKKIAFFVLYIIGALGLIGFAFVPVFAYVSEFYPLRVVGFENPLKLITYLFSPGKIFPAQWGKHEYQIFIGPLLFFYLLMGIRNFGRIPKFLFPLLICSFVNILMAMGSFKAIGLPIPSPFDLLRDYVPFFSTIRVPSRFLASALLGIIMISLWYWQERGITSKTIFWVLMPLVAFQLGNAFFVTFSKSYVVPRKPVEVSNEFNWVAVSDIHHDASRVFSSFHGISNCYESTPIPRSSPFIWTGKLIEKLPGDCEWKRLEWDHIHFRCEGGKDSDRFILLNMNYHRYWKIKNNRVGIGPIIEVAPGERLQIKLSQNECDFELVFEDPNVAKGIKISLLSFSVLTIVSLISVGFRIFLW